MEGGFNMGTKDKQQSKMQDSLISQSLFTSFSSSLGSSFADTSISLSKGGGSGGGGGGVVVAAAVVEQELLLKRKFSPNRITFIGEKSYLLSY